MYSFRGYTIEDEELSALKDYVNKKVDPGSLLRSVLSNDFVAACAHADEINLHNLPAYAKYLYNELPSACWGTKERVDGWLNGG